MNENGEKVRISKVTGVVIPKPEGPPSFQSRVASIPQGPKDTSSADTLKKTYKGEDFVSIYKEFMEMLKNKEEKEKALVFSK